LVRATAFFNTEDAESAEKCGSERAGKKERENRELRCGSGFEAASQLALVFGEVEGEEGVFDEAVFAEFPFFGADDVDFFIGAAGDEGDFDFESFGRRISYTDGFAVRPLTVTTGCCTIFDGGEMRKTQGKGGI
jgi:hypothetical protein